MQMKFLRTNPVFAAVLFAWLAFSAHLALSYLFGLEGPHSRRMFVSEQAGWVSVAWWPHALVFAGASIVLSLHL